MLRKSFVLIVGLGFLVGACVHGQMAYVGLSDDGNSFVKVVSPKDATCGTVNLESETHQASSLALQKKTFDGATICEGTLPKGTLNVRSNSEMITIPQAPQKVVILGDTGCRLRYEFGVGMIQNCDSEKEWPFHSIMRSVAKENSDLVVHVGDYHYREFCSGDSRCKAFEGATGYGYKPWAADFLTPAEPVLKKVPFIFVRGNHEDCHRAHEGFTKLLSPVSEIACKEELETQYISFGKFLIVNFDNSDVDDRRISMVGKEFIALKARYLKMIETLKARPETEVWLFTHRPIWGLVNKAARGEDHSHSENKSDVGVKPRTLEPVNVNLQALVMATPLPSKIKMIFSGHIHAVQLAVGDHPPQMVVGESGTSLDSFSSETLKLVPEGYRVFPSDYGYVLMTKDNGGKWTAAIKSVNGETDFTCQISEPGVPCVAFK